MTTDAATLVALGVGTHTLTLTVTDGWDGSATASVTVDVTDANAALTAQVAALQAEVTSLLDDNASLQSQVSLLQAQLSACLAAGGDGSIIAAVNLVTTTLRRECRDPSFVVPGATPQTQFDAIMRAMLGRHDSLENLYAALKPKRGKKPDRTENEHTKGRGRGR